MITALYTCVLAIMFLVLSYNVIFLRYRYNIPVGDGGNKEMQQFLQARANFIDYVPLALVMVLVLELMEMTDWVLHVLGSAMVFSRLLQGWGLSMSAGGSVGRISGAIIMHVVIITGALCCLWHFIMQSKFVYEIF